MGTYTNRKHEKYTVKQIDGGSILFEEGMGTGYRKNPYTVRPGDVIMVETSPSWRVTGMFAVEQQVWLWRLTDEDIEREHQEMVERLDREREAALRKNRADWERRTTALPHWLQCRIRSFQESGGHAFERDGWGYELTIAELALLYAQSDGQDSDEVMDYAREHGTSGNQHGFAKALAAAHAEDPAMLMDRTVSALSPITGDLDYSGR